MTTSNKPMTPERAAYWRSVDRWDAVYRWVPALAIGAFWGLIWASPGAAHAQDSYRADSAPAATARAALAVKKGVVVDIQTVTIEIPSTTTAKGLGGVIGGLAGALLGAGNGGSSNSWQAQTLAGSVGAAAGTKVGEWISKETRDAQQVIVQPDQGEPLAVVQEAGADPLTVGQRVYIVGQAPALRVVAAR